MALPPALEAGSDGEGSPPPAAGLTASFLDDLAALAGPAADLLAASRPLRQFLAEPGLLTLDDRRTIVEQALVLLEQNYVHLPLKIAMHGVNPVQRLRLLAIRLERQADGGLPPDPEPVFHAMLSEILNSLRDLHTGYLLPEPYAGHVAYLPFLIEECVDDGATTRYLVTRLAAGFAADAFEPGAEITHWCGVPIARAVERNAERVAGSNAAARHARGLESLTIRPLLRHLPPDEEWVTVTYRGADGVTRELRHEWLVVPNLPPLAGGPDAVTAAAAAMGIDPESDEAGRAKLLLFARDLADDLLAADGAGGGTSAAGGGLPTSLPRVFRARAVTTPHGTFGHIRIFTFRVDDPDEFVAEFARLLGLLPQKGLIVDVRDNGGGHIHAAELALQTLTPRRITPAPVQFISTPLNLRLCRGHRDPAGPIDLAPWVRSLEQARETGASYSGAAAMTPSDRANAIGQRYHGPVVLIVNALCYSATDIFAAGFADHGIGTVLGVHGNTGAGGANVWTHDLLHALDGDAADGASPYRPLPAGAGLRVAIRRTLRVGDQAGTPLEDLGVQPDEVRRLTRRDVLEGNEDLLARAGELLAGQPVRALEASAVASGERIRVRLRADNVERAVILVDDQPRTSVVVTSVPLTADLDDVPPVDTIRVEGYDGGRLVACRVIEVVPSDTPNGEDGAGRGRARMPSPRRGVGQPTELGAAARPVTLIYVHGAGNKLMAANLKRSWDRDLFGRDIGDRSVVAHYADVLHSRPGGIAADACSWAEAEAALSGEPPPQPPPLSPGGTAGLLPHVPSDLTPDLPPDLLPGLTPDADVVDLGDGELAAVDAVRVDPLADARDLLAGLTPRGRELALSLTMTVAARAAAEPGGPGGVGPGGRGGEPGEADFTGGVLPFLPKGVRSALLRQLLRRLIPDADAYFFGGRKEAIRDRLRRTIAMTDGPLVVVAHSLGTIVAYDVLSEDRFAGRDVRAFVTLGSPLGYREIQDVVTKPLRVPRCVGRWINVADRIDPIAIDTGLAGDFAGGDRIIDLTVDNASPNSHAVCGYLVTGTVRGRVNMVVAPI